tara:strand:- start:141 stop:1202 length:1062 start_codon:yes stop_codon:yes gene_type:complete
MAYTTIDDPEAHFQVVTYTGDGQENRDVTLPGTTDLPVDFVWVKNRDAGNHGSAFYDKLRGATKRMEPYNQNAESTKTSGVSAFNSDGFDVGNIGANNSNTVKYIAFCWKANGSGSSDTNGTINSTATSANTTAGFSIVTYTGNGTNNATVGHGLGKSISWMLLKNRDDSENWWNYHAGLSDPSSKAILLNSTNAEFTPGTSAFYPTNFSTSLFSMKNDNASNSSGDDYVAWCWSEIKGFSKFGKYTGNGSSDGPFIYTGFKPAWLMIKNSERANTSWTIYDNKRPGYNSDNAYILAEQQDNELSDKDIDLLSNGFRSLLSNNAVNTSGDKYIYMAFAESPFVNSNGVPATAR